MEIIYPNLLLSYGAAEESLRYGASTGGLLQKDDVRDSIIHIRIESIHNLLVLPSAWISLRVSIPFSKELALDYCHTRW
jgi:hypothetical protein